MPKKILLTNLTDKEIKICQVFAESGKVSVSEAAGKAGIPRTTIYNFIGKLVSKNLLKKRIINNRSYYYPNKKELEIFDITAKSEASGGNFICFSNADMIKKAIKESLKCRKEVVFWMTDSKSANILGDYFIEKYIEAAFKKGVKVKVLRSASSEGTHRYHSEKAITKAQREVRRGHLLIPFHSTIIVHDDNILFLTSTAGGLGYGIKDKELAESHKNIFKGLWKYAKVLGEAGVNF